MRRIFQSVTMAATLVALTLGHSCTKDEESIDLSSISITVSPQTMNLKVGDSEQIVVTAEDYDGSINDLVEYSVSSKSSNADAVSVSSSGLVLAEEVGEATVAVTHTAASHSYYITVTVTEADVEIDKITISGDGVEGDDDNKSLSLYSYYDTTVQFSATVTPSNATDISSVAWSIEEDNDNTGASITTSGLLTIGTTLGTFSVKATVRDNLTETNYSDMVTVTISEYVFSDNKVSFDGADILAQDIKTGECATPPSDPTDEGYTFIGWFTDATYQTEFDFTEPITGETTIYAYWWDNAIETYTVSSETDLVTLRRAVNAGVSISEVTLANTIDLSTICNETAGSWTPIGTSNYPFQGLFKGQSNTIKGLYINSDSASQGLFGYTDGAMIQNLTISDGSVTGLNYVGGIVARATTYITMLNCHNDGVAVTSSATTGTSSNTGGIAGYVAGGEFTGCSNSGTITGYKIQNGGIVGAVSSVVSTFTLCYNTGTIYAENNNNANGGIAGALFIAGNKFIRCYNEGDIIANSSNIGGIVGQQAVVTEYYSCYNTGDLSCVGAVGGIVGNCAAASTIAGCYNTGTIANTTGYAGGIIGGGSHETTQIIASYNAGTITSDEGNVGGIAGNAAFDPISCYWLSSTASYGVGTSSSNSNDGASTNDGATSIDSGTEITAETLNTALGTYYSEDGYGYQTGVSDLKVIGIDAESNTAGEIGSGI